MRPIYLVEFPQFQPGSNTEYMQMSWPLPKQQTWFLVLRVRFKCFSLSDLNNYVKHTSHWTLSRFMVSVICIMTANCIDPFFWHHTVNETLKQCVASVEGQNERQVCKLWKFCVQWTVLAQILSMKSTVHCVLRVQAITILTHYSGAKTWRPMD